MSGKRQATSNLNHDNWDQEEEPEERGTFRTAPPEELRTRVIKQPTRRRLAGSATAGEEATETLNRSVFSGFSGFGGPAAVTSASSPFAFLSNIPAVAPAAKSTESPSAKASEASTSSAKENSTNPSKQAADSSDKPKTTALTSSTSGSALNNVASTTKNTPSGSMFKVGETRGTESFLNTATGSKEMLASVADLNRSILDYLKDRISLNPHCILTPVFQSYNKYVEELRENDKQKKLSVRSESAPPTTATSFFATSTSTATTAATTQFSFGNAPKSGNTPTKSEATSSTTSPANTFSFGIKPTSSAVSNKDDAPKAGFFSVPNTSGATAASQPKSNGVIQLDNKPSSSIFSGFGKPSDTQTAASTTFSFSSGAPFSFGNIKPPAADAKPEEDEEDTPPVVEFNKVVEDDAVYSKRCKVFIKKDEDFVDRGVGTLYLKPVKDSEKMQMLVRADTNLGNILVNLLLAKGLPAQRMGKNNVMMVCVPTPEETKPMSMLVRVKTGEEADELLEKIKQHTT